MFDDFINSFETSYGRLVILDEYLVGPRHPKGYLDMLLITNKGEKFLDEVFPHGEYYFEDGIRKAACTARLEKKWVAKADFGAYHTMLKTYPFILLNGAFIEIATLEELQRHMGRINPAGSEYEFVPHNLYLGSRNLIITDWLQPEKDPEKGEIARFVTALSELFDDAGDSGLDLDLKRENIIYLGKNGRNDKFRFAIVDQYDPELSERMRKEIQTQSVMEVKVY